MTTPIYPEVKVDFFPEQEIVSDETKEVTGHLRARFELSTLLRIQHGGTWYLIRLNQSMSRNPKVVHSYDLQTALSRIHAEAWIHSHLYVVDPELVSTDGRLIHHKHQDQRSEEDRLIDAYNLRINKPQDKPIKKEDAKV